MRRPCIIHRGHRLLLVDGDPAVERMISSLFEGDGHIVETARDGAHADLVIADPRAGGADGELFAETLLARWPALSGRRA